MFFVVLLYCCRKGNKEIKALRTRRFVMAYYKGVFMTAEEAEARHEIDGCLKLGCPLTSRQRAFYLLFMATAEQVSNFLKNEKTKGAKRR